MRRIVVAAAVITLLAITGCSAAAEPDVTLTGTIDVPSGLKNRHDGGEGCLPTRGYEDVDTGTQVIIRDAEGTIIGTATLGHGEKTGEVRPWNGNNAFPCTFAFEATVPVSDFYAVEVGRRGEVTFTREDVENGAIALSLGL